MRSLKIATGTVLASTALLIAAPLASASDTQCDPATAAAQGAESAYQAALADYQKQINNGGHPGQAERANVDQLKQKADSAASQAQRICGDTVMNPTNKKPNGAMHTGFGSTSESGTSVTSYAVLGGAVAALGATAFVVRRRSTRAEN
ncbi:hypothetical protein [Streptomyces sp. bgisy031]|uniref:hypothetical protein n=1 Tax=Streptomyces sp. bgisy031 TaxID=3413772 RepID=UPI003D75941F